MECVNCGESHSYEYCPYCGEKAATKKISLESVTGDAISSLLNMDKGFLYNIKALTLYPKDIILRYINGQRKGILNPISFLVISISLYLIIETLFKYPVNLSKAKDSALYSRSFYNIGYAFGKAIIQYFKFFWIFIVLFVSNATILFYRKYNYIEHVTINSFILGYATLLSILGYLILKIPIVFSPVLYITMFLLTYQVYGEGKNKIDRIVFSSIALLLFFIQIMIVGLIMGIMIIYL